MKKYKAENSPKAWLFLLPALIFIILFNVYPLIRTFIMSLQSNSILNPQFVGIENFKFVLSDPKFHLALKNTFFYAIVVVPVSLIISMVIALILNNKLPGEKFFEAIFFIPYLTSIIAIGIVFRYMFHGQYGFINYILGIFNIGPIDFLESAKYNMTALIIFGIWMGLAFNIIVILSGLRGIDDNYYKVAEMFGATRWEQFRKVTLPSLSEIITFLFLTNFISAFKIYSQVFALFNGKAGIGDRLVTAVFYIYNKFYVENRYGHAMAAAVILFILLLVLTFIQRKILKKITK